MRLKAFLAIAALAIAVAPIASPPASAATQVRHVRAAGEPLPFGPFQIQGNNLTCAAILQPGTNHRSFFMDPCDPRNPEQEFIYDPVTHQILVAARPGNCLQAFFAIGRSGVMFAGAHPYYGVHWRPCNPSEAGQKFLRHGPDAYGRYWIITTVTEFGAAARACLIGNENLLGVERCGGYPADVKFLFRFPPV